MATVILDASIVLALFDPADEHHVASVAAIRKHRDAGDTFLLPASTIAEVLVGACRQRSEELRLAQLERAFGLPRPIDAAVALAAARLRAHYPSLRLPDAIVLAVATVDDADVVLTADKAWSKYDRRVRVIK